MPLRRRSWNVGVVGPEDAATEHDLRVATDEAGPPGERDRHPDELVGEAVDDRAGDGVTVDRGREHGGRELADPGLVEPARVVGMGDRVRAAAADGRRDRPLERRPRAAPVLAPDRRREAGLPDAAGAAPVAGDVADAGEPDPPATRA